MRVQRAEIQIRVFYTSALDRVRWSALLLDRFTRRETNPVIWRTKDWFKVVTQSKILIPEENLSSSAGFGALSLLKKKKNNKNLLAIIIFTKVSIFPLLTDQLLSGLKFTKSWHLYRKYSWGFTFFGAFCNQPQEILSRKEFWELE